MVSRLLSDKQETSDQIAQELLKASGGRNPSNLLRLDKLPDGLTGFAQSRYMSCDRIFAALQLATPEGEELFTPSTPSPDGSAQPSLQTSRSTSPAVDGAAAIGSARVGSKRQHGGLDPAIPKDLSAEERQMVTKSSDEKGGGTSYKAEPTGRRAAAEANQALAEAKTGTDVFFFSGSALRDYDGKYHPQATSASASTLKEKGGEEDEMEE